MSAGAMVGPPKPHHDCLRRLFNPLMSTSENGSARWSFALCQSGSRPGARAMRPSRGNRWRRRGGHPKDPKDPKWRSPQNGPCARQSPPLGNATMIGSIEEWGSEGLARPVSGDHHYRRRDWADGQRGRVCCATNQTSTLGQQFWATPPSLHAAPPNSHSHSHSLTLTACLTPPVAHPPTHSASPELDMMGTPWAAAGRCWPGATVGGDAHGKRGTNGTWTGVEERVSKFLTWDARRRCPTPKPSVFNNGCPPRLLSFSFSPQPISQFSSLTIILTSVVHSF